MTKSFIQFSQFSSVFGHVLLCAKLLIELINITSVGDEQKTLIELLTKHGLHNFTMVI